ncbi:MAG: phosphatase [Cyclobacteriaceae bacterium]
MNNRFAIIDMGTNTFHLLIVSIEGDSFRIIRKERNSVRLGLGGIDKQIITDDAKERAIRALFFFHELGREYQVSEYRTYATSAVRNAKNNQEFVDEVLKKTKLSIEIIDGEREAELIYKGVKLHDLLNSDPSLIIDIGGGSVEFIIANDSEQLWMQSFEIGGQRLKNLFHTEEPMPKGETIKLFSYLEEQLAPLQTAINTYKPKTMIGCSGTFDTLLEIEQHRKSITDTAVSASFFRLIFMELLRKDRSDRLSIEGMIMMRVDLIVVASCIVDYVFKLGKFEECIVSKNALKEGVVLEIMESIELKKE